MQTALLSGLIAGMLCAYLGVFVVLKKIVFVGIALSEVAGLGVAAGLFLGLNSYATTLILTLFAILLFWLPFPEKTVSRECLIGFVYALCAAFAVILIARNPEAVAHGINLVSGNLLYAGWRDIGLMGVIALIIAAIHLIFFKEFIFVSFDRETALTTGIKANFMDFLLYLSIGFAISISMKVCGIIFVFASLVIPAMTGLLITKTIWKIFLSAVCIACFSVTIGLFVSYRSDFPSGPTIVGLYALIFVFFSAIRLIKGISN